MLRNLEHEGLICRTVYAEVPPRVEYCISSHGETVRPLIQAVRTWGREHLEWKQLEDGLASPRPLPNSSKRSTRQRVVNLFTGNEASRLHPSQGLLASRPGIGSTSG